MANHPLVVDLDGTLVQTDTLFEVFVATLFIKPFVALRALIYLLKGRASFKRHMSTEFNSQAMSRLPYREDLLDYLRTQKKQGRPLHLVSAADEQIVAAVSGNLDLFDTYKGSNGSNNLKGRMKAAYLKKRFPDGFAYAGDSTADIPVWKEADEIILAGNNKAAHYSARKLGKPITACFDDRNSRMKHWLKAARLHQWSKNVLLLVPAVLGAVYADPATLMSVLLGIFALGLVASGTYILNDLSDLAADRAHPTKKNRPFASGALDIASGLIIGPLSIVTGLIAAFAISPIFACTVLAYLSLTLAYSLSLKKVALLDTFIIGSLFTLRLVMGAVLASVTPSEWLLTFSMFFFFSLALAKRHVEIKGAIDRGIGAIAGRGYGSDDSSLTLGLGLASAVASIQILVFYLVFEAMPAGIYSTPVFLWIAPTMVSLWVLRVWYLAHRGTLDDDPVTFAVKDPVSIGLGCCVALGLAAATMV